MKCGTRTLALLLVCLMLCGCEQKQPENERVTLTWYLRTDLVDMYNELKGFKQIQENVGVNVIFQAPPDNSEDAYRMMVASGNLPDIIMWLHSSGIDRMAEEGTAIELTGLIAEYAPNLTQIYTLRPEIRREVETADGKIYFFPSINPMQTLEEVCRKTYTGMIVRNDWLEKLGIATPRTIQDWYEMLVAFKTRDPNGNNLSDEIPFDGWGLAYFAPAYGVLNTFCVNLNGEVVYGPMEQEYKSYLEMMNRWYEEGLLGSNCFVQSDQWKDANITGDLTGAFLGLDNAWRYYMPSLTENAPDASMLALPWIEGKDGVKYTPRNDIAGHTGNTVTIVTSQCAHPEAAVRLIDYLYTEEGGALTHWGILGETYEVVNGEKRLLPFALQTADDGYLNLYHYAIGHTPFPKYDGELVVLRTYPDEQLAAEMVWADASPALIYPPAIRLSTSDTARCTDIMNSINNYLTEMEVKFITGEEPLSNFDQFVGNLKRMGIDDALALYRRQYELYISK